MKSLKRVQTLVRVFKILSIIAFAIYIVSTTFYGFLSVVIALMGDNETIVKAFASIGVAYDKRAYLCILVCATVENACGIYIAYLNKSIFDLELGKGTPFDKELVSFVRSRSIIEIIVAVALIVVVNVAQVAVSVAIRSVIPALGVIDVAVIGASWIGSGIFYLLLSLLLDYGADLAAEKKETEKVIDNGEPFNAEN